MIVQSQNMRHDFLGLRRMLGTALDEHLPTLVNLREGGVRFQVEVLLPAKLNLAAEPVGCIVQGFGSVSPGQRWPVALKAPRFNGFGEGDKGREGFIADHDGGRSQARRLQGFAQHPAHGVAVEHDFIGEERLVVFDAGVVDPGNISCGKNANHTGDFQRRCGAQLGDPCMGVRCLNRPGVQHILASDNEVIGVQGGSRHMERRALVGNRHSHYGIDRAVSQ